MIRRVRRNAKKVLKSKLKKAALSSSLVLALSVSMAGGAIAQGVISNNLPVPNYIDGATFKYNNGSSIQAGNVNQQAAKSAADCASRLDIGVNKYVADLKYNSYNIAKNKVVNYNFSSPWQVALNRVTQANPSYIHGNITGANGKVFLINPNGILFGANSAVNVGGFMASTHNYKGKAADLLSGKIELVRDSVKPTGIFLDKGAVINAPKGVALSANAIVKMGAKINAGYSTAQLITGDGVHFSFSSEIWPVNPDHVKATQSTANYVQHPHLQTMPGVFQMGGTNSIEAGNVTVVSKVNSTLNHPFLQFVNLEGLNTAKAISTKAGKVFVHAENVNSAGQAGGIYVKNAIKAHGRGGEICLKGDNLDLRSNIFSETISLMPSTPNMEIVLGEGTAVNPTSYQVLYDKLQYLNARNINIGNDTNSYVHGAVDIAIPDSASVNLTIKTRGDVEFELGRNYPTSMLNFTRPNSVLLTGTAPGVGITTGDIIATDSIVIVVTDEDIVTGDLCASVGNNQTIDELIKLEVIGTGNIETEDITAKVGNGNQVNKDLVSLTTEDGNIQTELISLSLGSNNVFENNVLGIDSNGTDGDVTTGGINFTADCENVFKDKAIDVQAEGDITTCDIKINLKDGNQVTDNNDDIADFDADGNVTANNIEFNVGDNNEFDDGIELEASKEVTVAETNSKFGDCNLVGDEFIKFDGREGVTTGDVNICIGDKNVVEDDVIDYEAGGNVLEQNSETPADINAANIKVTIGKDNYIDEVVDMDIFGEGDLTVKDITVKSQSDGLIQLTAEDNINTGKIISDAQWESDIEILANNNVTTGDLCANNEVIIAGKPIAGINEGDEININAGDTLPKANEVNVGDITADEIYITANTITTGNIDASAFVWLEDDVAINVGDVTSAGSITITATDGDIVTGNLCATLGNAETSDNLILLEVDGTGDITTKNITAKVGNGNTINYNVVNLVSGFGDITTGNVNVNVGSANSIGSNVFSIEASGNITTCDINTSIKFDNNINNGDIVSLYNYGTGDITTRNITTTTGSSNSVQGGVVLYSSDGNIQTENILAGIDSGNSFSGGLIALHTGFGDITTKNITADINASNTLNTAILMSATGDITTYDINAEVNNQNSITNNLIGIDSFEGGDIDIRDINVKINKENTIGTDDILRHDVLSVSGSPDSSFTAQNIDIKIDYSNTVSGDVIDIFDVTNINIRDINIRDINVNICEDNTIGEEVIKLISDEDITTKNINVNIGEGSTVADKAVEIVSNAGSVETCDIIIESDDTGDVNIQAAEDVTTGKICSDTEEESGITILTPGNVTTNDLLANGDIFIARNTNLLPDKADIVTVNGDITCINLTIAGNSITTGNINNTGTLDLIDDIGLMVGDISSGGPIVLTTVEGDLITGNLTVIIGDDETVDTLISLETGTYGDITTGNLIACAGSNNTVKGDAVSLLTNDGDITTKDIKVKFDSNNTIAGEVVELTAAGKIGECNIDVELGDSNTIADANLDTLDIVSLTASEDITRSNIKVTVDDLNQFERAIDISTKQDINTDDISACIGNNNTINSDLIYLFAGYDIAAANIEVKMGDSNQILFPGDIIEMTASKVLTTEDINVAVGDNNTFGNDIVDLNSDRQIETGNITVSIGENCPVFESVVDIDKNVGTLETYKGKNIIVNSQCDAAIFIEAEESIETCDITSNGQTESNIDLLTPGDVTTKNLSANDDITIATNTIPVPTDKADIVTIDGDITATNLTIVANSITTGNIATTGSISLIDDIAINVGDITSSGPIILSTATGDIVTGNLTATIGDDESLTDLISLQITESGNITTKNITAHVGDGNIIENNVIGLFTNQGDITTKNITACVGDENTIGGNVISLLTGQSGDVTTCDINAEIGDGNSIGSVRLSSAGDDADIFGLDAKVNGPTGDIVQIFTDFAEKKAIAQSNGDNITTNDINVKVGDENTFETAVDILAFEYGNITTKNITAYVGDGNNIGGSVISLLTGQSGDITTCDINAEVGDDNTIGAISWLLDSAAENVGMFAVADMAVGPTGDIVQIITSVAVAEERTIAQSNGAITTNDINVKVGNENTFGSAVEVAAFADGDVTTNDITVNIGDSNNFGFAIGVGAQKDNTTINNILANVGDDNNISQFVVTSMAGEALTTQCIDINLGDNNNVGSNFQLIEAEEITPNALLTLTTAPAFSEPNPEYRLVVNGSEVSAQDICVDIGKNNTINSDVVGITALDDVTTKNIKVNIGDNSTMNTDAVNINTDSGNVATCDIRVTSETDGIITIDAGGNITTDNIVSDAQDNSNINLLTIGDVTTKELAANNDIQISASNLTDKANDVETDNISADNLTIIANSITTGNIITTGTVALQDDVAINVGDIVSGGPIILTAANGDIITGNLTATIGDSNPGLTSELILIQITETGDIITKKITATAGSDNVVPSDLVRLSTIVGDITTEEIKVSLNSGNITSGHVLVLITEGGNISNCDIRAEIEDGNTIGDDRLPQDIVNLSASGDITRSNICISANDENSFNRALTISSASGNVTTNDISVSINDGNTATSDLINIALNNGDVTTDNILVNINDNNSIGGDVVDITSLNDNITTQDITINLGDYNNVTDDVLLLIADLQISTQNVDINIGENDTIGGDAIDIDSGDDITTKCIEVNVGDSSTLVDAVNIDNEFTTVETCDINVISATDGVIQITAPDTIEGGITTGNITSDAQANSNISLLTPGDVTIKNLSANNNITIATNTIPVPTDKADVVETGDITADNLEIIANSITTGNINTTGTINLVDDVAINVGDIVSGGPIILTSNGGDIITGNLTAIIDPNLPTVALDNLILLEVVAGSGDICTKNITAEVESGNEFNKGFIALNTIDGSVKTCDITAKLENGNTLANLNIVDIAATDDIRTNDINVKVNDKNQFFRALSINSSDGNITTSNIYANIGNSNAIGSEDVISLVSVLNNVTTQNIDIILGDGNSGGDVGSAVLEVTAGNEISIQDISIDIGSSNSLLDSVIDMDAEYGITTKNITADIDRSTINGDEVSITSASGNVTTCDIEVTSETDGLISIDALLNIQTENITSDAQTNSNINLFTPANVTTKDLSANGDIQISQNDLTRKSNIVNTGDIMVNDLEIIAESITTGNINATGAIDLQDDANIKTGKIVADKGVNLTASEGCIETDAIVAGGDVNLFGERIIANDKISTSANFNASKDGTEKAEAVCVQDVTTTGDLTIIADEMTFGDLSAGDNMNLIDDSFIKGNSAIAGGDVLLVSPEGNFDVKTVKGNKVTFSEYRF